MTAVPRPNTQPHGIDMLFLAAAGGGALLVYCAILLRLPLLTLYTLLGKKL